MEVIDPIWKVILAVRPSRLFKCSGSARPGTCSRMRSVALALDEGHHGAGFVDAAVYDFQRLLDDLQAAGFLPFIVEHDST